MKLWASSTHPPGRCPWGGRKSWRCLSQVQHPPWGRAWAQTRVTRPESLHSSFPWSNHHQHKQAPGPVGTLQEHVPISGEWSDYLLTSLRGPPVVPPFCPWRGTGLVPSLSKDVDSSAVANAWSIASQWSPNTSCVSDTSIKSVYSCCLCMYSSVQVSLSSLETPPAPSVISRGVGGVFERERIQRLVSCNFVYSKRFVSSKFFLDLNTPSPGKIDSNLDYDNFFLNLDYDFLSQIRDLTPKA